MDADGDSRVGPPSSLDKPITPPKTAPSYLSVSKSSNGYNSSTYYNEGAENAAAKLRADYEERLKESAKKPERGEARVPRDFPNPFEGIRKKARDIIKEINEMSVEKQEKQFDNSPKKRSPNILKCYLQLQEPQDKAVPESTDVPDRVAPENLSLADLHINSNEVTSDPTPSTDLKYIKRMVEILDLGEPTLDDLNKTNGEHGGASFQALAGKHNERLMELTEQIELELNSNSAIPEEMQGAIRCAVGSARLIVRERFRQFEGLCKLNMNAKEGDKQVPTANDLTGFWELIMIEVSSIYDQFRDVANAAANGYVVTKKPAPEPVTTPKTKKPARKPKAAVRQPVAARQSVISSARAAHQRQAREAAAEMLTPESPAANGVNE